MTRRSLFFTLAAGLLALSLGGIETRAGLIPVPTTLDQLLPAGNNTVAGTEPDTFSGFSFSSSYSVLNPLAPCFASQRLHQPDRQRPRILGWIFCAGELNS